MWNQKKLRTFKQEDSIDNFQLHKFSRKPKCAIFHLMNETTTLPLLKTTNVTVSTHHNPYTVVLHFNNKKEVKFIEEMDEFVVSLIEKNSKALLVACFNKNELLHKHVNREMNNLSNFPFFHMYKPSKCTNSLEKLIHDMICHCALDSWYIQVFTKTWWLQVLWFIK